MARMVCQRCITGGFPRLCRSYISSGIFARHRSSLRQPNIAISVILAGKTATFAVLPELSPFRSPTRLLGLFRLFFRQRRRSHATEDSDTTLSIELLHALFLGSFAGSSGGLVGAHASDIGGIVDVP